MKVPSTGEHCHCSGKMQIVCQFRQVGLGFRPGAHKASYFHSEGLHIDEEYRRDVEGQQLREYQAAHHRQAKRAAGFGPGPETQGDG